MEIRILTDNDAEELFKLIDKNRQYLRRWLPWLDTNKTVDDSREFISQIAVSQEKQIAFHTSIRNEGVIAGMIGIQNIDWLNRKAAIGYWIGEEFQGKGLVTAACSSIIEFAFLELELNRLEMYCATGNHKSRKVPERLGFRLEGVLKQSEWLYDHYVDHVLYALVREEWKSEG